MKLFDEERLVRIGSAPNQMVAEMWRDLLAQEGIPAVVQTSDGYAYVGPFSPCSLLTVAYQADRARAVLASLADDTIIETGETRRDSTT